MNPTTEVTLTMRPARAFIMPRRTARERRKTDFRLVAWMSSHSSSFMRARRLSRVAPALLTRIATAPNSSWTLSTRAAHCAASRTSSARPAPFAPRSASALEMPSAPFSVVAVPIAVAPDFARTCRMPSPMPREAPVTIATCASSMVFLGGGCGRQRGRVLDGDAFDVGHDAFRQARENLARTAFDDALHSLVADEPHGLDPAPPVVQLLHHPLADARRVVVRGNRAVVDHGDDRLAHLDRLQSLSPALGGRCHPAAIRGGAHPQDARAPGS